MDLATGVQILDEVVGISYGTRKGMNLVILFFAGVES